jgi:hypothetical protein
MPMAARRRGHARRGPVFRRIWATYDDSKEARAAFELAAQAARRSAALLTVVQIVSPPEEGESLVLHSASGGRAVGSARHPRWRAQILAAARAGPTSTFKRA